MKLPLQLLISVGWLIAGCSLFVTIVVFDLCQNMWNWNPDFGVESVLWGCGIIASLIFIWWLGKKTHDGVSRIVAVLVCLILLGCAVAYRLSPEQANGGLMGRTTLSPWWYRDLRSLLFCLPIIFWLWRMHGRLPFITKNED